MGRPKRSSAAASTEVESEAMDVDKARIGREKAKPKQSYREDSDSAQSDEEVVVPKSNKKTSSPAAASSLREPVIDSSKDDKDFSDADVPTPSESEGSDWAGGDSSGSEYGKKKKSTAVAKKGGGRGRKAASSPATKGKGRGRGRPPASGGSKNGKKAPAKRGRARDTDDSDDSEAESSGSEYGKKKKLTPSPKKGRAPAKAKLSPRKRASARAASSSPPPAESRARRGRPSAKSYKEVSEDDEMELALSDEDNKPLSKRAKLEPKARGRPKVEKKDEEKKKKKEEDESGGSEDEDAKPQEEDESMEDEEDDDFKVESKKKVEEKNGTKTAAATTKKEKKMDEDDDEDDDEEDDKDDDDEEEDEKEDKKQVKKDKVKEEVKDNKKPEKSNGNNGHASSGSPVDSEEEKEKKKVVKKEDDDDDDDECDGDISPAPESGISEDGSVEDGKSSSAGKELKNRTDTDYSKINLETDKKSAKGESPNFKIACWNIGGIKAWLKKNGLEYLTKEDPDILCLNEVKCNEKSKPVELTKLEKYPYMYWSYNTENAGQSGVAIFSKEEAKSVQYGFPELDSDSSSDKKSKQDYTKEGRLITVEYEKFYLINAYVPNGGRGVKSDAYPKGYPPKVVNGQRQKFDGFFRDHIKELEKKKGVIVTGDLNVAHEAIDLANPKTNERTAGFTKEEREGMTQLLADTTLFDSFRALYTEEKNRYTFWSYMNAARSKNIGWRLDYFLMSEKLRDSLCDSVMRTDVYGSDHCPIVLFMRN